MFDWFRRRRRQKILAHPFPEAGRVALERDSAHYVQMDPSDQRQLRDLVQVFVAEKRWEACAGIDLTFDVRITIAAQACLLLLGLNHDYFRNVRTILVYPSRYEVPQQRRGPGGVITESTSARLGEAWVGGPVVLSWADALAGARNSADGRNVVIHEFAHKLDFMDGLGDGTPRLADRVTVQRWRDVMTAAYEELIDDAKRRRATLLNKYGATNPPEFFAVATEAFFEKPRQMKRKRSDLYEVLQGYFGQDPAAWLTNR